MREEKIPSESAGSGEPPIPVPPANESWSLMRDALDVRMPVTKAFYLRPRFLGVVALTAAVTTMVFKTIAPHSHRASKTDHVVSQSLTTTGNTNVTATTPGQPPPPVSAAGPQSTAAAPNSTAAPGPITAAAPNSAAAPEPAATAPNSAGAPQPAVAIRRPTAPSMHGTRSRTRSLSLPPDPSAPQHIRNTPASQDYTALSTHSSSRTNRTVIPANSTGTPANFAATAANSTVSSAPRQTFPIRLAILSPGANYALFRLADSLLRKRGFRPAGLIKKTAPTAQGRNLRFTAGITISEQFNFDQQKASPYTINGKSNILPDYLPSAHLRAYSGDSWDLQLDLSALQPQYTGSQLIDSTGGDSSSISPFQGYRQYNVYVAKKLFYSEFAVTLHRRIYNGLWLGAGLTYGRLQGAVGQRQILMKATNPGVSDTVINSEVVSIKTNDTAYHRLSLSDWRILLDAEYQWHRLTVTLRYERALNSYLPVQADGSKGKEKNESFSLRLGYELWQRRR